MSRYEALIRKLETTLPTVSPSELQRLMTSNPPPLIVDVRETADYELGAIEGSINLPRTKLEANIENQMSTADQKVIVYCGSRGRSQLVCRLLDEMGIDAAFLRGGLENWSIHLTLSDEGGNPPIARSDFHESKSF